MPSTLQDYANDAGAQIEALEMRNAALAGNVLELMTEEQKLTKLFYEQKAENADMLKLLEVAKKEIVELQGANLMQQAEQAVIIAECKAHAQSTIEWLERHVKSFTDHNTSLRRSAISLEVLAEANQGVSKHGLRIRAVLRRRWRQA